ncbi:MAG: dehalogenase [Syntrophomonadaceae bacterium]|nr:dehalogenase [Syntrophomonadaceae bacterium]
MGFLWLLVGICIALAGYSLIKYNQTLTVPLKWWDWLLIALWGALLMFTFAFVGTSYGEGEPRAGNVGGVIFGIITIVSGVGLGRWIFYKKSPKSMAKNISA